MALSAADAGAQVTVALPNTSQQTMLTALVDEQAQITVPAVVAFAVTDISAITKSDVAVSAQQIILASGTKQLRISVAANAPSFSPSVAESPTWAASNVSWSAGPAGGPNAWQGGGGTAGTLSTLYSAVATCNANTATCSMTKLSFSLAAAPTVTRSGAHTLTLTWKFESIGT
jgi:hypothetical protein